MKEYVELMKTKNILDDEKGQVAVICPAYNGKLLTIIETSLYRLSTKYLEDPQTHRSFWQQFFGSLTALSPGMQMHIYKH